MSNEFKLVPVEPTAEMEDAGCQGYMDAEGMIGIMHKSSMGHAFRAMLAAAPQPPAIGGELEVVYQYLSKGEFARWHSLDASQLIEATQQGFVTRQLIDRAHLAPLQAEIERWKACYEEASDKHSLAYVEANALADQVDQLKARCDGLEALLNDSLPALDQAASAFKRCKPIRDRVRAALSKPAGSDQV